MSWLLSYFWPGGATPQVYAPGRNAPDTEVPPDAIVITLSQQQVLEAFARLKKTPEPTPRIFALSDLEAGLLSCRLKHVQTRVVDHEFGRVIQ